MPLEADSGSDSDFGDFQDGEEFVPEEDRAKPALLPEAESKVQMSETDAGKIKSAMGKLELTPPPWAKAMKEEDWLPKMFSQVAQGNKGK